MSVENPSWSGRQGSVGAQKVCTSQNMHAVRGMRDQSGSGAHLYHKGIFVACHSAAPPPVAEYEAWLEGQRKKASRHLALTGPRLRRMVVMKRSGSSLKEIGAAAGLSGPSAGRWLHALPPELAA